MPHSHWCLTDKSPQRCWDYKHDKLTRAGVVCATFGALLIALGIAFAVVVFWAEQDATPASLAAGGETVNAAVHALPSAAAVLLVALVPLSV